MTKKEENQQNLNTSFKLKLIKKPEAAWCNSILQSQGLYEQLRQNANKTSYNPGPISLQDLQKAVGELYVKDNTRSVKLVTNQAGLDLINEAFLKEAKKQIQKNEHRKKLSFRSKILKQTYKFR